MRAEGRKAREDLSLLIALPPEERRDRLERSTTRFHSRAFAQCLLRESRTRVRSDPSTSAQLAELVPLALDWIPETEDVAWARALCLRAEAHRANADRVAGDLAASARRFAALRERLRQRPAQERAALAEIDSMEASLCIDQRRFTDADRLLDAAADGARAAGHRVLLRGILVQRANLHGTQSESVRQIEALQAAAREFESDDASYERLCLIVSGTVALCDVGRYDEATECLDHAEPLFRGQQHAEATLTGLRGRVALGRERWSDAAEHFRTAQATFLAAGRAYDAALAALDLAHVHLASGDAAGLRTLAAELVPSFRSREVAREALAALRLLAEAVAADRATLDLVAGLRRRLRSSRG